MFHAFWHSVRAFLRHAEGSLYHIVVLALSAGTAMLLPVAATHFLSFWSRVEHEPASLILAEMTVAIVLMVAFNHLHRSRRDRALASMATGAGLVSFLPRPVEDLTSRIAVLQEEQGSGRTVMAIGSSGYSSLADRVGSLSSVLDQCLGARIMLVNPSTAEAAARIQAGGHPAQSLATFQDEVRQSIALMKRLKAIGKDVKLKLYDDPPIIKMMILGDYLWLQHYHADLDVRTMPEYVVKRNRAHHGLYTLYAHYFVQRWENPQIPEYDLDTDELVYRAQNSIELRREPFEATPPRERACTVPSHTQTIERTLDLVHVG